MEEQVKYSFAMEKVEQILSQLNGPDFDIDTLAEKLGQATELLSYCKARLEKINQDVEAILEKTE